MVDEAHCISDWGHRSPRPPRTCRSSLPAHRRHAPARRSAHSSTNRGYPGPCPSPSGACPRRTRARKSASSSHDMAAETSASCDTPDHVAISFARPPDVAIPRARNTLRIASARASARASLRSERIRGLSSGPVAVATCRARRAAQGPSSRRTRWVSRAPPRSARPADPGVGSASRGRRWWARQ